MRWHQLRPDACEACSGSAPEAIAGRCDAGMFRFAAPAEHRLQRPLRTPKIACMKSIVKPRRKPLQSRAWMTTGAIQDAFVLLLVERGYEKVSMRDIAGVAGVGLGTLYLYFPGKDSIAAVTVRSWMRRQAAILAQAAEAPAPRTIEQTIRAMVAAHVREPARSCRRMACALVRRAPHLLTRKLSRDLPRVRRACFAMPSSRLPTGRPRSMRGVPRSTRLRSSTPSSSRPCWCRTSAPARKNWCATWSVRSQATSGRRKKAP